MRLVFIDIIKYAEIFYMVLNVVDDRDVSGHYQMLSTSVILYQSSFILIRYLFFSSLLYSLNSLFEKTFS